MIADDHQVAPLPFELVVLELAIKDVCQICSQLTKDLEALVYPALDALTKAVRLPALMLTSPDLQRAETLFFLLLKVLDCLIERGLNIPHCNCFHRSSC